MKKITLFLLAFSVFLSAQNPVEYMNQIEGGNEKILTETWEYMSAIARQKSARKIEKRRKEVQKSTQEALDNVKKAPDFKGDTSYRDASVRYLEFNLDMIDGKVNQLINMEEIADNSFDQMEAYILYKRELNKLNEDQIEIVRSAQKNFADKNNINLVETKNKLSEKVKKGNQIFNYKEDMYLVFARCSMYEQLMLKLMNTENEKFDPKNAALLLLELTDISKTALDSIKDINNDKYLRIQTQNAINFFREEAEKYLPEYIKFQKTQNEFNELKTQFDALANNEKTKEKVAEYNKAIVNYNKAIETFNRISKQYETRRTQIYNNFNNASDIFVERHMPK